MTTQRRYTELVMLHGGSVAGTPGDPTCPQEAGAATLEVQHEAHVNKLELQWLSEARSQTLIPFGVPAHPM